MAHAASLKLVPAAVISFIGIAATFGYTQNDDATWLFTVARRIAGGASLYSRDIVEFNLPLIVQLSQVAVWLSNVTGIQAMNVWRILVSLLLVLSLTVSIQLLRKAMGKGSADLRAPLAAMFAFVFACLPNYDFGQREHLLVMAFTPYVLAAGMRSVRLEPTRAVSILVGVLLAAAVCLKPHHVIAILLVELFVVCYRRTVVVLWRTELVTAGLVLIAYGVHMIISYPGFFVLAIPLTAKYYAGYSAFQIMPIHFGYFAAVVGAVALTRFPRMAAVQCRLFAVAGFGAFIAFMVQDKGWPYQFLPAKSFFLLSAGIGILAMARAIAGRMPEWGFAWLKRLTSPLATCVALVVTVGWTTVYVTQHRHTRNTRVVHRVEAYLRNLRAQGATGPFAALSVSLFPAFPLTERLQAEWGMRFSCLWPLPSIIKAERHESAGSAEWGRQYLMDSLVDDFERWKPALVLVQETYDFPMVGELVKDPRFAQLWRRYRLVGEVEYFQVFERSGDELHATTGVPASSAPAAQ